MCLKPLTASDRRWGYVRCAACRKNRGHVEPIKVKKKTRAFNGWTIKPPKVKAAPTTSWWTNEPYRSDRAAFTEKAESLAPKQIAPMTLKEWIT